MDREYFSAVFGSDGSLQLGDRVRLSRNPLVPVGGPPSLRPPAIQLIGGVCFSGRPVSTRERTAGNSISGLLTAVNASPLSIRRGWSHFFVKDRNKLGVPTKTRVDAWGLTSSAGNYLDFFSAVLRFLLLSLGLSLETIEW